MFDGLQRRLEGALKSLRGEARLTEENVAEALRDVRRALLEADVELSVVRSFVTRAREKALGTTTILTVTPGEHMVQVLHEALVEALGGEVPDPSLPGNPAVVLMCGLQGSGKTTTTAKLARWLRDRKGRRPFLVACDIHRPAAAEQLALLGRRLGIPVHAEPGATDAVAVARRGRQAARDLACDLVIYDTAGRLQVDEEMMAEAALLRRELSPQHVLFVADAMTGQEAARVAKVFHETLRLTGVILTKADGDARGGAALSVHEVTGAPLLFLGTGEGVDAFEPFDPGRVASRILGMGDVVGLVEKARELVDDQTREEVERKLRKDRFDLQDLLDQFRQIRKLGSMSDLIGMLPGGAKLREATGRIDERDLLHAEAVLLSMTRQERANPRILDGRRRARIARGSGTSLQKVNQVLRQYEQMKSMMGQLRKAGPRLKALEKLTGGKGGLPPGLLPPGMGNVGPFSGRR